MNTGNNNAFPIPGLQDDESFNGLTVRDYFAAKALQGMLADLPKTLYGIDWQERTAESAYQIADAMIKARDA